MRKRQLSPGWQRGRSHQRHDPAAPVSILVGASALGDIWYFAHGTVGRGLLHRMFHSVVRLENVSARRRHAIRQRSGPNSDPFAREHLFSNRQADLLHRADSSWLGNWTHCCPTKIESGLAHCRFGPDRVDGCHRRNSSQSDIGPRRIRTHQNEFLQSSYFWSVYFPVACYMHS